MSRIFPYYALSGFVSLGYQMVWFRVFTDWFGSTNLTLGIVVANFMAGLAVGALLSRQIVEFIAKRMTDRNSLRVFGFLEFLIGVTVLLTVALAAAPPDVLGNFPYVERNEIWVQAPTFQLYQILTATVCVFIPCILMGATYPLLCANYVNSEQGDRFPSALYAWNALGACVGVIVCQMLLLPKVGHGVSLWLLAFLNMAFGLRFLLADDDWLSRVTGRARASLHDTNMLSVEPRVLGVLYTCAVLSGLLSGALEGDLLKRITFVLDMNPGATMSFIIFWIMFAMSLGGAIAHRVARLRLIHIKAAFLFAIAYYGTAWLNIDAVMEFVTFNVAPVGVGASLSTEDLQNPIFPTNLIQLFVFVGVMVFPPYLMISLLLPYLFNRLQRYRRHLGAAYGVSIMAFCIGVLGFAVALPRISFFFSAKYFFAVFALTVTLLLFIRESRRVHSWLLALFSVALVAAAVVTPSSFDREFFRPNSVAANYAVRALKSNGTHTSFIVDAPDSSRLFLGRQQISSNKLHARTYTRLMAHFPLLLHENPKNALLIGLGIGTTGAATAAHDSIREIDVIDLNDQVIETSIELGELNDEFHKDPRVRWIHDDARNFLSLTQNKYDLISSQPPPPLAAGAYRLYSREYYEQAAEHLTSDGLMTQWLPLFLMNPEAAELAISTFVDVFSHTLIISGYGNDFILVGSRNPLHFNLMQDRFYESPSVLSDLQRLAIPDPVSLMSRVVQSEGMVRRRFAHRRVISDERNDLEHLLPTPQVGAVIDYDPKAVLNYFRESAPDLYPGLEGVLTHLGRLRYHAPGFPFESLATVSSFDTVGIALADIDWTRLSQLFRRHTDAIDRGHRGESYQIMREFLSESYEQPEVLLALARSLVQARQHAEAIPYLENFHHFEPNVAGSREVLGIAYQGTGRLEAALPEYLEAARLNPDGHSPLYRAAWLLATHPDAELRDGVKAVRLAQRAHELAPRPSLAVAETLGAAYAASGEYERAITTIETALDEFTAARPAQLARLRHHLQIYRSGNPLRLRSNPRKS